jgi:hypothetical protein
MSHSQPTLPEFLGPLHAKLEISHERFPAYEELVRKIIPRADLEAAFRDQAAQQRLLLRPDFEVILNGNELTVHLVGR